MRRIFVVSGAAIVFSFTRRVQISYRGGRRFRKVVEVMEQSCDALDKVSPLLSISM